MPFWYFNEVNPNHLARTGEQLYDHVTARQNEQFIKARAERDAITTPEQLKEYVSRQRKLFLDSIGGIPESDVPLSPKVTSVVKADGYKVENIVFTARKSVYVTGSMYIPDGITYPAPAVLFVSGHHQNARMNSEYQKACVTIMKQGIIVFAFDPLGQGERISYLDSETGKSKIGGCSAEHDQAGIPSVATGKYLARYFLADEMRALDYMLTRPEIDPDRIGLTGNSGGGTQTAVLMAMDDRIACAAPGTFISSRKAIADAGVSQDSEQTWPSCALNGFDHVTALLMMAPKPVDILAVRYDFFPIEGTVETYGEAKRFYEMFGKADNLRLTTDHTIHSYSDPLIIEAAEFFAKHLCKKDVRAEIPNFRMLNESEMYATKSGQIAIDYRDAVFVPEETAEIAACHRKTRLARNDKERLAVAETWLRDKVYKYRRYTDDGYLRWMPDEREHEAGCTCMTVMWRSQKDLFGFATVLTSDKYDPREPRKTVVCIWDDGTRSADKYEDFIVNKCGDGWRVVILDVTGIGNLKQTPLVNPEKNPRSRDNSLFKLGNEMLCLGDSLAALRTFDVLRALDIFERELGVKKEDMLLYADGIYGIYGVMAGFLEKRIPMQYGEKLLRSFERERIDGYLAPFDDDLALMIPGMTEYFDYEELMR